MKLTSLLSEQAKNLIEQGKIELVASREIIGTPSENQTAFEDYARKIKGYAREFNMEITDADLSEDESREIKRKVNFYRSKRQPKNN